jgi:hypothetical protein
MFVERRTRMYRMAALPTPIDPVPAVPQLSLVPPTSSPAPESPEPELRAERARFRRLVVFTGKIS